MSSALGDLTTPEQYIKHYFELLKTDLSKKELQISKVGLIGYFLNILGYSQFDIKQYFDSILKEAFVATSDVDDNLNLHASIYRYTPSNAVVASLVGNFQFDFAALPTKGSDVVTRNIYISNLKLNVDDMNYILDSQYLIINNNTNYVCQITNSENHVFNVPFLFTQPTVLIKDLFQYSLMRTTFQSPSYTYGTYYSYIINIADGQSMSDITVYVNDIMYDTQSVKWVSQSEDNVVFLRQLSGGKILIELGSGIHGRHIPNSEIKVVIKTTNGANGNISAHSVKPYNGSVSVIDTLVDDTTRGPVTIEAKSFITTNIDYGENGTNPLVGDDLRVAILDYINSRETLIAKSDFINLIKNFTYDNFVLFKKTDFVDNIIYNFAPIMDKDVVPVPTLSHSMPKTEFDAAGLYRPEFVINSEDFISPFIYVWDAFKYVYNGYIIKPFVSAYFSQIDIKSAGENQTPPALNLSATYLHTSDSIQFDVTSYESLIGYDADITIPEINITDQSMIAIDSNTFRYIYPSGLVYNDMDVSVTLSDTTTFVNMFDYTVNDFALITDVSDVFFLKTYGDTTNYVLNVPVIPTAIFEVDEDFYLQKFISLFGSLGLSDKTKMISDEVQMRFINSNYVTSSLLKEVTTSGLEFDLILPFQITVNINGSKEIAIQNKVNVTAIKSQLEFDLAEHLLKNYTGTKISFYKTKIIDLVHNYGSWIKSVSITIADSNSNDIPDGNFETYDQNDILDDLSKFAVATFCPIYWYWDLNNITINVTLV